MVQRVSAHRLQVTTPAGAQIFADTAPFDEPLEGEDYRFVIGAMATCCCSIATAAPSPVP